MNRLKEETLLSDYSQKTRQELIEEILVLRKQMQAYPEKRDSFFSRESFDGMLVHQDGKIIDANNAAQRLLGSTKEDLCGHLIHEFVVSGWHDRVTTTAGGESKISESIWVRSDRTTFLCECQNIWNDSGQQVLHFRKVEAQRRPMQERLLLAEEVWDLYNNTPCGYHTLDENGLVLRMNATELNWLGYSNADVLGEMRFEKLLGPRSRDRFLEAYLRLSHGDYIQDMELELLRRDGSTFPVLISGYPIFDAKDTFVSSRFTVFDISELKRTTKDFKDSEEKFRVIAEQSLIGIFILQEGRLIYANESMRRITGYTDQELFDLGIEGFFRLIHPDDRNAAQSTLTKLMLEGDSLPPRDFQGLHKNGARLWLELSASHMVMRGVPSVFGMVADITEKKRAEAERGKVLSRAVRHQTAISKMASCEGLVNGNLDAALVVITQQVSAALDMARVSIWFLGEDESSLVCHMLYDQASGDFNRPNVVFGAAELPFYFQMLTMKRTVASDGVNGEKTPTMLLRKVMPLQINAVLDVGIRLGGSLVGSVCLEHVGRARPWQPDEKAFAGEMADQITHAIMSHRRKLSEAALRKAERTVRALNSRLQKRVKERTAKLTEVQEELIKNSHRAGMADIATAVLHNVGNILTSVITSGQTIEKTVQTSSLRSMKKANKLLDDLLTMDDARATRLREFYHVLEDLLIKEHHEINENVEQVLKKIDLIRDVITAQQSYASSDSQAEQLYLPDVVEDALSIQEHTLGRYDIELEKHYHDVPYIEVSKIKLIHVIINLIKNAREATETSKDEDRKIILFVGQEGNNAVLKVRDNGVGISAENREKLFSHGFSTKKDGHGFGLHSCLAAVETMGGTIRVESEGEGMGATFIVSVPIPERELTLDTPAMD